MVAWGLAGGAACPGGAPLEDLGVVPAWTLVDDAGQAFSSADLAGKPYVVSFFFTSCVTVCPKVMAALSKVRDGLEDEGVAAHIVSISVDPEYDTPARLARKAADVGALKPRWRLLTGPEPVIRELLTKGFMVHMGRRETLEGGIIEISHSAKLALVDGAGHIRGLFSIEDDASLRALVAAADRLD
jgi:protein SCO1/2